MRLILILLTIFSTLCIVCFGRRITTNSLAYKPDDGSAGFKFVLINCNDHQQSIKCRKEIKSILIDNNDKSSDEYYSIAGPDANVKTKLKTLYRGHCDKAVESLRTLSECGEQQCAEVQCLQA